ncbi:putative RNA polymerase subunit [Leishmania major strain Friedlin]|uniref:Putative RNA polymerase subunit n=1 Tax=Leishmania major TaxID=5664 RepID=Q4QCZ1_LEIMA|nr:putative RNA polymerase subunit [Leishmania major strain Friedlin]CAG9573125.1 DNA-directed_RNA_polymerase_2_-_RPB12_subunit_-_putative [Leishmania major strain Friedlin]CAJ03705.1 putative RNA polymerase subunit [Leishmania major strain Friedlin]|eukprot:XP_001682807.1 putative RNA polymerase subunit [Leishmania major strain Friedlin]
MLHTTMHTRAPPPSCPRVCAPARSRTNKQPGRHPIDGTRARLRLWPNSECGRTKAIERRTMSGVPIKTEVKQEEGKYGATAATQESKPGIFATQETLGDVVREDKEGTLYICGNCTAQLYFKPDSRLVCPICSHITGASTVFYKIRTEPTTYDTV